MKREFAGKNIKLVTSVTMSGGAYITTNVICTNGFMIEARLMADVQPTHFVWTEDLCQTLQNESADRTISMRSKPYNGSNAYAQFRSIVETGVPFDVEASIIGTEYYCKFNGVVKNVSWSTGSKATSFPSNPYRIGTQTETGISTFYGVKFYDNREKVTSLGDFVPAVKGGVPGLFDLVGGEFYTNDAGKGEITYTI